MSQLRSGFKVSVGVCAQLKVCDLSPGCVCVCVHPPLSVMTGTRVHTLSRSTPASTEILIWSRAVPAPSQGSVLCILVHPRARPRNTSSLLADGRSGSTLGSKVLSGSGVLNPRRDRKQIQHESKREIV